MPVDTGSTDLAAEAPVPTWTPEGEGAAHRSAEDPRKANKKLRNAARTTIAGGAITVLGLGMAIGGASTLMIPKKQLAKLEQENGGVLPPDDPKRQRAIVLSRVLPAITYAGAGLAVAGALMAVIAGRRFKRLREDKRTSVAFGPMPMYRGGGVSAEVRF